MTNFFSSIYATIALIILCAIGVAICFALCVDLITIHSAFACVIDTCSSVDGSAIGAASVLGFGRELDFRNLERKSENVEDYADQYNPEFLVKLAKAENAQADRLEKLFNGIAANAASSKSKTTNFGYADILPWRERVRYHKNIGEAKRAAAIEKAEAVKEAKSYDSDEDFQEGYKKFLATEFDHS